jgi:hypothetical protein
MTFFKLKQGTIGPHASNLIIFGEIDHLEKNMKLVKRQTVGNLELEGGTFSLWNCSC